MDFLINQPSDKEAVKAYIDKLPDKPYKVNVSPQQLKRTIPQSRLYRLWLRHISKETGNDVDALHRLFRGKFLGFRESVVFGVKVHEPISTATLSKEAFTDFLNNIQAYVADFDIILPQPEDLYFQSFLNQYDYE